MDLLWSGCLKEKLTRMSTKNSLKVKETTPSLQYASHEKLTNRRGLQRFIDV